MMDSGITVTIKAASTQTRMIVREGPDEVLIARLAPVRNAPRQALPRLMHSLALWFKTRVRVVLYAESPEIALSSGLVDGLLCGLGTFHFEVDLVLPGDRRRGARLRGLGNLRDLRRDAERDATR
jgi:hypothetical protein